MPVVDSMELVNQWRATLTERREVGDDEPLTLSAMAKLAHEYRKVSDYRSAKSLQVELLSKRRRLLGDDHPDTVDADRRVLGGKVGHLGVARYGYIVAAFFGLSFFLAFLPSMSDAQAQPGSESPGFAGDYVFFASGSAQDSLVLSTDGTYQVSNGDQGHWASMDNAVVLSGRSNAMNTACLFLGTATSGGINTKRLQGPSDCDGDRTIHWYAVRAATSVSAAPEAASEMAGEIAEASVKPEGKFSQTDTFPDDDTGTLTIKPDGLDIQEYTGPGGIDADYNFGHWATQDGVIAFAVESSQFGTNAGCIFIGDVSKSGIGTSGNQGVVNCGGYLYSWSAIRIKT
jgi:Tetratricopeptide repeat